MRDDIKHTSSCYYQDINHPTENIQEHIHAAEATKKHKLPL